MKPLSKTLIICLLLMTSLILFQSCVAYQRNPTTLEIAEQEHIQTKITNSNGESAEYKYITYEDGQFYGVTKKSGKLIKSLLRTEDIRTVKLKDKIGSTMLWIGIPLVFVLVVGGVAAIGIVSIW
ncbi:hypothetical protein [Robiginitalea sp. SC105]|uniref:hypothetical protein n=1 Tax=Robiginitalea sp. SC105 TaxID=2762332 RepID=UPI00163A6D6B|nr:hypothetical protein [Robiginitalea sp. SC105]MBC2839851.1 hypothetical protein [Robiginitalea sp. SC105]